MADPAGMEAMLLAGATKARALATPFMAELRQAVGLRGLGRPASAATVVAGSGAATAAVNGALAVKAALPSFKQYREKDGQFYFKLVDARGHLLLQSAGFASPRDAGQAIAQLQDDGPAALARYARQLAPVAGVTPADVAAALQALKDAAAA